MVVLLSACGGAEDDRSRTPEAVVAAAASTIAETPSLRFQITVDGPGVEIEEGILATRLDGEYQAPDAASTRVRVSVLGLTASIDLVTIGDRAWQQAPLESEFSELPAGGAPFSAAELFSPEGIPAILRGDLSDLERLDPSTLEDFPGETFDVIRGRLTGTTIADLTRGLVDPTGAEVTMYVTGDELRRIVIVEPERNTWTIDAWAYGEPVTVAPPPGFE